MAVKNAIYFIAARLFDSSQRAGRSDSLQLLLQYDIAQRHQRLL